MDREDVASQCFFCKREVDKIKTILAVKEGLEPEFIEILHGQVPDSELYDLNENLFACEDCYKGLIASTLIGRVFQTLDWDMDQSRETRKLVMDSLRNTEEDQEAERTVLAALYFWLFFEEHAREG